MGHAAAHEEPSGAPGAALDLTGEEWLLRRAQAAGRIGHATTNAAMLINGGACVALLAIVAAMPASATLHGAFAGAITFFAFGLLSAAASYATEYLAIGGWTLRHPAAPSVRRRYEIGHGLSFGLILASFLLFTWGALLAKTGIAFSTFLD